ncbi:tensin-3-like isoform X2 [Engraulis encrasicolus]|uniref:tensin-3-like isoform X2 n=1 Tax=Engraulis encrasicolus TaxID=184585 RepID=UPI002FD4EF2E
MDEGYELDLTYVTERIIAVSFPRGCTEETYLHNLKDVTRMLKSKHADNYMVINLSEKRHDLSKMNPKTLDTGWPDLHAPPLDKICTICKAMESWLHADPLHVVVIHCRGGKGRIGVVISSFVHFTDISASADQALDRFAMRKFYDDKVSALMTPSQKRYVWILNSLLSGSMKINASPLFLHCVILHGIPNFDSGGVCRPYLKVYQGMQAVYSSGVYIIGPGHRNRLCIALEPAQLLKGDIMVKCYHKSGASSRDIVFRLQFHTGAVQGYNLMFEKEDMECANKDPRFPDYGKVELVFSEGPENIQGAERWQNGPDVTVDYSLTDPLTRWDSYQNICNGEVPQSKPQAPTLDKAVAARSPSIGGSSSGGGGGGGGDSGSGGSTLRRAVGPATSATSSPEHSDHALSASSDSGLSNASLWTERGSVAAPKTPGQGQGQGQDQGPSQQEKAALKRLLSGFGLEEPPLFHGAMDGEPEEDGVVIGGGGVGVGVGSGVGGVGVDIVSSHRALQGRSVSIGVGGVTQPKERETDILDDEVLTMSGHDLRSVDSLGTLSSSCHKSSQNSLLSDGFGSPGGPEDMAHQQQHQQHHLQHHLQHQQHHHQHQQQQHHHLHLNHNNSHHIQHQHQHQHHHLPHQQHSLAGMDEYEARRGCLGPRSNPVPVSSLPPSLASCGDSGGSRAGSFRQGSYSTHTWVQQQQMVAAQQYSYLAEVTSAADNYHHGGGGGGGGGGVGGERGSSSSPLSPEPAIATAAVSAGVTLANVEQGNGMDAVAAVATEAPVPVPVTPAASQTVVDKSHDEEFNSLTVDIDNSIDQLNQLIMDLDPTFVPIPTRTGSVKRNGGGNHANGPATACTNGTTHRVSGNSRTTVQPAAAAPGDVRPEGVRCLSRQASDVPDHPATPQQPWGLREELADRVTFPSSCSPHTQHGGIFRAESLDYRNQSVEQDSGVETGSDMVPPTPAFPISPPTPYNSRVYSDIISHASEAGGLPDHSPSCHHPFASTRSATLGGTLARTESPLQSPWQEGSMLFRQASLPPQRSAPAPIAAVDYSHHSPPGGHHPAPKAHSSPRGSQRSRAARYASCRSPARSFDEQDGPSSADSFGGHTGELLSEGSPQHHHHHHLQQHQHQQQQQQFHQPPLLPEKRRASDGEHSLGSASPALSGFSSPHSGSSLSIPFPNVLPEGQGRGTPGTSSPLPDVLVSKQLTVKFVQDTSKFWYKPDIARDQAIAVLKDKEPGSFIVRDSHSFRGAYGLAMKVATPPPSVLQQSKKGGDLSNELVRHFLIECTQKGVRLKGCPNEPYFGSLTALVCQHSITPLALPCKLIIPDRDPLEDVVETTTHVSITNSATELLKQGAACNVWFLGSVEMESLTGYQAIQKATGEMLSLEPLPTSTVVHFKVSSQGITLTDNQRKLFFRRHYAVTTVIFCALDPQDRKWKRDGCASARIFGFVARKSGSAMDNVCHLFAEHDPEQPASAIVNFVSKVMIGSQKN